jgi:hypothetical protein
VTNPCIKTGVIFQVLETGDCYRGDLFFDGVEWQVRGFTVPGIVTNHYDIIVSNVEIRQRSEKDPRRDTNPGIGLEWCSPDFLDHIQEWYPHLLRIMP